MAGVEVSNNRVAVARAWSALFVGALCACAADAGTPTGRESGNRAAGSGAIGAGAAGGAMPGSQPPLVSQPSDQPGLAGSTGLIIDSGPPADAKAGCAATSVTAPPPANPRVDIVWVIDASGSMLDEQKKVGANMAAFAEKISKANLDVRIVMMTTSAAIPVICPIVPPDPLTGTALAGDPRYKFIESGVDSHNALDVATRNFPMYSSFLRPDATTHFVIVSDDESTYKGLGAPAARADAFYADMKQLLGHDFIQHTISSDGPTPCNDPNCMPDETTGLCVFVMLGCGAAAPGATYYALARNTKGLTASLCESDFSPIFDRLSAAVIASAPLPCSYTIPPPPAGETLDPMKVNVGWKAPNAPDEQIFPKASDQAACGDQLGWYYDNAQQPKQVLLCPSSCKKVADGGGTLGIAFGCETIVVI
ncbi:MAG TPA: vWA domain-containing protein [Polyangiales bacterium]|nr:vWA domain-containing protein [Polyangiales bacterium]